tara:strand:- start:28 stop:849 length:822 start_codon:yes stop_codon:yes gene_type:complete
LKLKQILAFFLLFFIACEELPDLSQNPFEADSEDQIPEILFLDKYINGDNAALNWSGNKYSLGYSYKLSINNNINDYIDLFNWSEWTLDSSISLSYLDEGDYKFNLRTHFNFDKEAQDSILFNIDNIAFNSVRISPLIQYKAINDNFLVEVYLEEVTSVSGISLEIGYYSDDIEISSFGWGSIINQMNFSSESISIIPNPTFDLGNIKFDIAFSGTGFSGTGSLIQLVFSSSTSSSNLSETSIFINKALLLDSEGLPIAINEIVNGIIRIVND